MKIRKIVAAAFASMLLFQISCSRDEDPILPEPKGAYESGIFIANEGNFGVPNASVSFIPRDLSTIENNVFATNNAGAALGDVLQTIGFSGDEAYFVLNNSNKVTVANRYTMKKKTEFTAQLVNPRYIAFAKDFVYITNDAYGGEKYVSIYNKADKTFLKKINFTDAAENIVEAGGNIFVQNASYGFGNKISYIDTSTNTLKSEITVADGQINKIISSNSSVYAIAGGGVDSYIYQISSGGTIVKTIVLPGITNATNLQISDSKFYFSNGNEIWTMDTKTPVLPSSPLITVTANSYSTLYGFNVVDGKIFTSDANGFSAASSITVYKTDGSLLKNFSAGRASNGFFMN